MDIFNFEHSPNLREKCTFKCKSWHVANSWRKTVLSLCPDGLKLNTGTLKRFANGFIRSNASSNQSYSVHKMHTCYWTCCEWNALL